MPFITEDFLLQSESAKRLYHDYAKAQPIYDYHCHLPPKDLAENRRFDNLSEIWLEGDHYKWRAMRANGISEDYITGDAEPYDKFLAWAKTVPATLRNPLYHWTHLELKRYFDIDELLNEESAKSIWDACETTLKSDRFSTHEILRRFKVVLIGTTDDPVDDLCYHKRISESGINTKVYPAFRPDAALKILNGEAFNEWAKQLEKSSGCDCSSFEGFLAAIENRHDFFHEMGSRLSDHGLNTCFFPPASTEEASRIYLSVRKGESAGSEEADSFAAFMMLFFARLDFAKGWVKQLHLGALRNASTRFYKQLGPDVGFDSIGDFDQVDLLKNYLDALDSANELPKMVVYNLNPSDNYSIASMMGNYQGGGVPGKMQFGSGWWFLDQKEAMTWQMNALSNIGLLSRFVGMLTDSRSFMSYPRHEYFRRVLCNLLGEDMESGELPSDFDLIGSLVENICYKNAVEYFGMQAGSSE